jgi:hypothetical protein
MRGQAGTSGEKRGLAPLPLRLTPHLMHYGDRRFWYLDHCYSNTFITRAAPQNRAVSPACGVFIHTRRRQIRAGVGGSICHGRPHFVRQVCFCCKGTPDSNIQIHRKQIALLSSVRSEVFTAVTMKNVVFWDIKTQFVPHRRHITSLLQSPAG